MTIGAFCLRRRRPVELPTECSALCKICSCSPPTERARRSLACLRNRGSSSCASDRPVAAMTCLGAWGASRLHPDKASRCDPRLLETSAMGREQAGARYGSKADISEIAVLHGSLAHISCAMRLEPHFRHPRGNGGPASLENSAIIAGARMTTGPDAFARVRVGSLQSLRFGGLLGAGAR